tara:strand:- start:821 stop:1156 length:336 start_codon:yes stop_codon:yes gene_type:complete
MLDELNKGYVNPARALGFIQGKVIYKYTLRNTMIPAVTVSGLQLENPLGGTVVSDTIFAWPGIGQAIYLVIFDRDYPLIQADVFVLGFTVMIIHLAVDLLYCSFNPRVSLR